MNDRLLRAARKEPVDRTPVWFMRQAGRYLKEYRDIRANYSMNEMCSLPEIAAKVTLQPIDRFPELDAAIIFSDLLVIYPPMGIDLQYVAGEGPQLKPTLESQDDFEKLRKLTPEVDLPAPLESIRMVREQLEGRVPLIGFAGAPFTLASYLIEGGPSKTFQKTKTLMTAQPDLWANLMTFLAKTSADFLRAQIRAGAEIVQIFDSWVGNLSPEDYKESVLPYTRLIFDELKLETVPTIHFATGTSTLLELMAQAGGDVIGVDWRIPIEEAARRLPDKAIMGNLDPALLFSPVPVLKKKVDEILDRMEGRPGFIFNLGHGILPGTPPENVHAVLQRIHSR